MRAPEQTAGRGAGPGSDDPIPDADAPELGAASVLEHWRAGLHAMALPARPSALSWALAGGVVVLALAVGALVFVVQSRNADPTVALSTSIPTTPVRPEATRPERPSTTAPVVLLVHAAGAVNQPGLYRLPGGSRVADLIGAAGGLRPDADNDRLNLAAPLVDGARLYVPHRAEAAPPSVVPAEGALPSGSSVPSDGAGGTTTGPVNINTAGAGELDALPGVGPTTAAAILDYRNQHGPFRSVDDLLKVRGIGKAKLDQIRSLVTT